MQFPVESKIAEISDSLSRNRCVVLSAPPGSGKTTCVPPALLSADFLGGKKIVMLEPRRMAARNCAAYIASKLGEQVGGRVGYRVRLENRTSSKTRLEIVTEALLAQRLLADPELSDTGLVIFDEFHERSVSCDLSFALALDTRRALRNDLRLMVMSATLDTGEVASHLGDADVISAPGRMFPVDVDYLPGASTAGAVSKALEETDGDVLVFLPGEGEIRRAMESIAPLGKKTSDFDVLPLYGSLPKEAQDAVFRRDGRRKVVLSTSIAETSVTLEGVTAVVDSGYMRVPRFSPGTGMTALVTLPVSLDRAEQRRGRAGRVREGVCYRLWSRAEESLHPVKTLPEILDADLASLVISSVSWGALERTGLPWMTPPPDAAWSQARSLLVRLGALDRDRRLTDKGVRMASLPMHPRLANMIIEGAASRPDDVACILAALVEEGVKSRETDIRRVLDEVRQTPGKPFSRRVLALAKRFSLSAGAEERRPRSEGALLALAYPDRIAKNRGNGHFVMTSGKGAFLEEGDSLFRSPFIVCCDLDDRKVEAKVFLACPVEEEEIEELFASDIVEKPCCEWDRRADRVKSVTRRMLGEMVLSEKRRDDGEDTQERSEAFMAGIRSKGLDALPCWTKSSRRLLERARFVSKATSSATSAWPRVTDEDVVRALEPFTSGMRKWSDLEKLDMSAVIGSILASAGRDRRMLDALAPDRLPVPSGSRIEVRYDGEEPAMEVKLQECFGLMDTPRVVNGSRPVVMTLLSPAGRPIQVTKDLAGFWTGAYELVRKDMRGRYPKHNWPEDPLSAVPSRRTLKTKGTIK